MQRIFSNFILFAAAALTLGTSSLNASTIAVSVSGISDSVDTRNYTTGFAFTTSQAFTVTALGYYDSGLNGLLSSHDVGIYTSGGTLLVSTTVPSGSGSSLDGPYRMVSISPFLLSAGSYVIGGASIDSADPITVAVSTIPIAGITITDLTRFTFDNSLAFPSSTGGLQYMNPNFEVSAAVPEPSTFSLIALALVAAIGWRRVTPGRAV